MKKIPYPKGLPIIGHLFAYLKDRIVLLEKLKKENGDIFKLRVGPKVLTVITNPADIQRIMQTQMKNYYKSSNLQAIFGKGIFLSNDEEWKAQRNIMPQFFSLKYIEQCIPLMEKSTDELLARHLTGKTELDINEAFAEITFDVIMKCMVGVDLEHKFKELHNALNLVTIHLTRTSYSLVQLPFSQREFKANMATINDIIYDEIKKQKEKNLSTPSLVTKFLEIQKVSPFMDDTKIRDNIVTMMFAGYETTALSLSWLSLILATRPDIQTKVRNEIPPEMNLASLNHLKFTEAVINETIRLYPPGWAWTRVARADDELRSYEIKKGDIMLLVPYLTHRDPQYWKNPEDFIPERFLDQADEQPPFSFIPFGGGPRICVGMQFANIEMKIILGKLLKNYELTRSAPLPKVAPEATLHSAEGFKLSIKKI